MKRWRDGSRGMLNVNAIFAGFSGVLLAVLIKDAEGGAAQLWSMQVSIIMALLAFICFALAAEWITDALDENTVKIYLRSMFTYNLGVILVLLSLASILYTEFRTTSYRWIAVIPVLAVFYPWGWHCFDLLFADNTRYLADLEKDDV
ncbi:MAG TPA: hypothetical protein VF814_14600 [Casimicrobiaceae bacterium]